MRLSKHMMIAIVALLIALSVAITAYAVSTYYASITGTITVTSGSTGAITASPSTFTISIVSGGNASILITLTNTGSVPLTISGITTSFYLGTPATINDTGFVIQPGHSTTSKVTIYIAPGTSPYTYYDQTITFSATG
jgi:uncharacterized membrane protein